ncbi:MAG TPA: carboxypeptidase-like regulatory domain-containing protein [Acidobacteriaceae bacterium]|nr:carboxypeptidase-like regulatory domain-containing protein [Acidobacteriaceae bacterium]
MAGLRAYSKYFGGFVLAAATLGLLTFAQDAPKRGRKYKAPPPTTHMVVTVTRATTGKPVENASVIFHPIEDGKTAGNMELKTNDDGQTTLDLLEIGSTVRVQVLKNGFQTFGEDFKIDKDQMAIEVKLHKPAEQYSIYKEHNGKDTSKDGKQVDPNAQDKTGDAQPKDDATTSQPQTEPQKDAPSQQETKPQPSTTPQ